MTRRLLATALVTISSVVNGAQVSGLGTWETTLQARDLDGDFNTAEAYYDTLLGITWLTDTRYAIADGVGVGGLLTWDQANSWADSVSIDGITGWRLPMMVDIGDDGCNFSSGGSDCGYNPKTIENGVVYSEMATMFYETLGNKAIQDTNGNLRLEYGLTNSGPFDNLADEFFWTGLALDDRDAWYFQFNLGGQFTGNKNSTEWVWLAHDGSIGSPVPLPASAWLLASALGFFGYAGWRKKIA